MLSESRWAIFKTWKLTLQLTIFSFLRYSATEVSTRRDKKGKGREQLFELFTRGGCVGALVQGP